MRTSRKKNKRFAKKRALRDKHGFRDNHAFRDSMRSARRGWGIGIGK
jgi:hypothetical protein